MAEQEKKQKEAKSNKKKDQSDLVRERREEKTKVLSQSQIELERGEVLVRIFGYDIPNSKTIYAGLTRIKGISWTISHSVCRNLNLNPSSKISSLSKDDIKKVESFIKAIDIPDYLKNRRFDRATGTSTHQFGTDLDIIRDFDIKRQKKIRSWVGVRHMQSQPVRGQRTRSHFRQKKIAIVGSKRTAAVGVNKK